MPRTALIIRNIDGIEASDLKIALQDIKSSDHAPQDFRELHALINSDALFGEDQLARAVHLFKLKHVRDYLYDTIKSQTGNYVIYHLNGLEDSGELKEENEFYITEKIRQIPPGTNFDLIYLGGGHGDPQRGSSNLSKQQIINITNTLKSKNIKSSAVVLGSCFSAAYSGLYQDLLRRNGVMISNSLECGASNNFLQAMEWIRGAREAFFSAEDIRLSERGPREARSAVKRMLEREEFQDVHLENQFKLEAYSALSGQEVSAIDPQNFAHVLRDAQELYGAFITARNELREVGAEFYNERSRPLTELSENLVKAIYRKLDRKFQLSIDAKVEEYRRHKGLNLGGELTREEYQNVVLPMVVLSIKINERIVEKLRMELNAFIEEMQTDPLSREKIKEILNKYPMLKNKVSSMVDKKMEQTPPSLNREVVEKAIFDELMYRIIQPPATSMVLSTTTSISMLDFRTFDEMPPNASASFREDFMVVFAQISSAEQFAEVELLTQDFDGVGAKKQFNELFARATLPVEVEPLHVQPSQQVDEALTQKDKEKQSQSDEICLKPSEETLRQQHRATSLALIDDVLGTLRQSIRRVDQHNSPRAFNTATSLLSELENARNAYDRVLREHEVTIPQASCAFKEACSTLITDAKSILESDLGWGEYLANLLKNSLMR